MMPSEEKHKKLIVEKLHAALRVAMGDKSLVFVAVSQKDWDKRFRKYLRKLKRDFPSDYRVTIKLWDFDTLKDDDGHRIFGLANPLKNSWRLDIERHPDVSVAISALFHEWSHVLEPPGPRKSHHRRFGRKLQDIETHCLGD